jgi:2-(1,2-epoxy-1,2-dihydrophenyl)acetyl-CoA isomerase
MPHGAATPRRRRWFFCAGGDLKSFAPAPDRGLHIKGVANDLHRAISSFSRMDAVLITAVNGTAAGAGFSIAVTGDLVLAAESASFTMAYTKVGLSPDGSSSYFLPRLIGIAKTKELMLTNRTLSAQDAAQWGLVTEVVPDDQLAARADALAEKMAATCAGSNGSVKALMLSTFNSGLEEQMEFESRLIAERRSVLRPGTSRWRPRRRTALRRGSIRRPHRRNV